MPTSGKPIGIINTRPSDSLLLEFSSVGRMNLSILGVFACYFAALGGAAAAVAL